MRAQLSGSIAAEPIELRRRGTSARARLDGGSRSRRGQDERQVAGLRLPVLILLLSAMLPWIFTAGSLSISPYRLVLMVMITPCLLRWISGRAGRVRTFDIVLILHALWVLPCLIVSRGFDAAIVPFSSYFLESVGAFLVARCYIRNEDDFHQLSNILFLISLFLLPWALAEAFTGRDYLLELFALVGPTFNRADEGLRMGLQRVQLVFEHPILFGVFATSAFAFVHVVYGGEKPPLQRWLQSSVVALCAFASLSSAPAAALVMQISLLAWGYALRDFKLKWQMLLFIFMFSYIAIELLSNQSAVGVYISYFTFNQHSAFYRLLIWDYGWASIIQHPLFGIAFGDWARESWMSSSIDNFWLANAVRWGMPGVLLIMLAFALIIIGVAVSRQHDERRSKYKAAYLISMVAFFVMGLTVHFWGSSFVLFMFLLGSGAWLMDRPAAAEPVANRRRNRHAGSGAPLRQFERMGR